MTRSVKPDGLPGEFKCRTCDISWSSFMQNNLPCTDKQPDLDYTTSILVDRFFSKNLRQTYFNNVCRKSAVVAFVIRQLSSAYSLEQVVDSNRMASEESHLFPFVVYSWNSSIKDGSWCLTRNRSFSNWYANLE